MFKGALPSLWPSKMETVTFGLLINLSGEEEKPSILNIAKSKFFTFYVKSSCHVGVVGYKPIAQEPEAKGMPQI